MLTVGIEFITTENKYRGVSGGWAGWAIAHPVFGKIEGAAHPVLGSHWALS